MSGDTVRSGVAVVNRTILDDDANESAQCSQKSERACVDDIDMVTPVRASAILYPPRLFGVERVAYDP
jgi:hypothetical protein